MRSRPGWCDGVAGGSFGNDCVEALDDATFLVRHAAFEATERVRYAASRDQQGAAMEEAEAYAAAAAAAAAPAAQQPGSDYKLVAQAQSSGAAASTRSATADSPARCFSKILTVSVFPAPDSPLMMIDCALPLMSDWKARAAVS